MPYKLCGFHSHGFETARNFRSSFYEDLTIQVSKHQQRGQRAVDAGHMARKHAQTAAAWSFESSSQSFPVIFLSYRCHRAWFEKTSGCIAHTILKLSRQGFFWFPAASQAALLSCNESKSCNINRGLANGFRGLVPRLRLSKVLLD